MASDDKADFYDKTSPVGSQIEETDASYTKEGLRRKLKARHVQMIAIGSNIGTGLFLGSGESLHLGGPLGLVMGFVIISIAIGLGEMAAVLPVSGSFTRYATRFYDDSLGYAMGWQYWLGWVSVYGAESAAFNLLIQYWDQDAKLVPLWITIFVVITLSIHMCPVRVFGEVEFYVSALKVVAVVAFIIVTWAIMGGAGPKGSVHGGEYWRLSGLRNGLVINEDRNDFWSFASVFALAAFAAGGVEMIGIVAGETEQPRWNMPRAVKTLMWRIVIFYVLSMLFLSFVVPYSNENLIGGDNANSSPFVVAIKDAGIKVLPDILNAVVMICVCSVGSSAIYISSRTLHAMADDGFAFKFFNKTDSQGRPWVAITFSSCIGIILSYLNVSSTGAEVFTWFSAISGLAFFIAWLTIIACNFRFRAALKAQQDDTLERRFAFRQPLYPWLQIIAFAMILFMILCQFIVSVWPVGDKPSASNFFSGFLSVPIFLVMWIGHKLIYRTGWKKLTEVDLQTGRRAEDPVETARLEHYSTLPLGKRLLTYVQF